MKVLPFFLFAFLLLQACKPNSATESGATSSETQGDQSMENKVMAIHDEVMPKMKDINDLSAQLRTVRQNLKEGEDGKLITPVGLDDAMSSLKLADQAMWDCMKAYGDTKATLPADQLNSFY